MSADGTLPLDGIRVVDLTRNVAGPHHNDWLREQLESVAITETADFVLPVDGR